MPQTVNLPKLARAAQISSQSFDEATHTVEIVWTTGADVLRSDWLDGNYIERLETGPDNVRLDRLNSGAPFLDTHNAFELGAVIGSVVPGSARMEAGKGIARLQLSRSQRAADTVQDIRDGNIRNISAGYIVHEFTRTESGDGAVPVMTATDWEPVELSAVPVPADPGAQIRSAQRSASGLEVHPCVINRAGDGSQPEAKMAEEDKKPPAPGDDPNKKPVPDAENAAKQPNNPNLNSEMVHEKTVTPDPDKVPGQKKVIDPGDASPLPFTQEEIEKRMREAATRAVADERERVNTITDLAKRSGHPDFGADHIRQGTKLKAFREALMDKLVDERAAQGGPQGSTGSSEPSLDATLRDDRAAGAEWARRVLNKPAKGAVQ